LKKKSNPIKRLNIKKIDFTRPITYQTGFRRKKKNLQAAFYYIDHVPVGRAFFPPRTGTVRSGGGSGQSRRRERPTEWTGGDRTLHHSPLVACPIQAVFSSTEKTL